MNYYRYPNPYITKEETATDYLEVDGNVVMRQLSVFENYSISSNVNLLLADQPFEYDAENEVYADVDTISKFEFDTVWQQHLMEHEPKWKATKDRFPLGSQVIGCMKIFFPQGIIVELDSQIYGVTDYRKARETANSKFIMTTGYEIAGTVTGYDETNQWIELGSAQIQGKQRC